ncbi:MAG: alpha/beta hydrolase [Ekhidna sp.]|nr:alpha/beta hydrolase [Ekhidna sp.]MBC6408869.1 alpha/beta hydrolase [Ekhidna sp.]
MKRGFSVRRIILLIVVIVLTFFIYEVYTVKFRATDAEYVEQIANHATNVVINYLPYEGKSIRNILVNRNKEDLMVLLHGSPSSSVQWIPLVKDTILSSKVDFLMIDRPGYGYSSFGNPILSVRKQAEIAYKIIRKFEEEYTRIFLFGTSYGGTVASRLLMDYPDLIDGAVLMSSSMAPGEEYIYDISYTIREVPWLFPPLIVVANHEKMGHYDQLKEMEPLWDKIKSKLLFIHSTTDDLIYPSNIQYVLDRLSTNVNWDTVWVKNGEHSLYWSDRELVKKQLNKFVDSFSSLLL